MIIYFLAGFVAGFGCAIMVGYRLDRKHREDKGE